MEEAERRKAASDVVHNQRQTDRSDRKQSGGWQESESGMYWEPCDASVLDSSSDGLAAMHAVRQQAAALASGGTMSASQDDDENYTKGMILC